jgi:hypothetical protein
MFLGVSAGFAGGFLLSFRVVVLGRWVARRDFSRAQSGLFVG